MLKNTITTAYKLRNEFQSYDRDYYTFEAYEAIIEYFNMFDEDVELDVIAICCDFNESTTEEIRSNYNIDEDIEVLDYLNNNTYAIETEDNKILYIAF
jgi:hypothetical protein